jgi:hypothetical protein
MAEDDQSTDNGQQDGAGTGGHQDNNSRGFPENTPVAEMEPAQQVAYWKHQARKHENTVKEFGKRYGNYDQIAERARQYDALLASTQTDQERAVAEARKSAAEEARAAAVAEFGGQLVAARLHSALAGRLDQEQIEGLIEGVDPRRFLDDSGAVDTDKVTKWADRVAPKRTADLGQGARGRPAAPTDMNQLIRRQAGVS